MVIILWRINIRIIVFFVVLLINFVLILPNVYICGVILVLRLLISILIHSCNLRSLIYS